MGHLISIELQSSDAQQLLKALDQPHGQNGNIYPISWKLASELRVAIVEALEADDEVNQ